MVIDNFIYQIANTSLSILIPYTIAFLALLIASYTDMRTREVPDWLNLGLIGTGFGINLLFSAIFFKIDFILASVMGFAILFAIAWVMFYAGQWGGGDSKILMGLGALIGIDFLSKNYFLGEFLINALLVGALYGILWSIFLIFRNRNKFIKAFKKSIKTKRVLLAKKIVFVFFIMLILISVLSHDVFIRFMVLYLAVILVLTFYLWVMIKIVEDCCMLKYVKPQQLTEGDWIAKDININGKYLTGPKDLGIEKRKIRKLIELYKMGKVKKILIKEGIPFVPSFFVAYVITLLYGNLVTLLV